MYTYLNYFSPPHRLNRKAQNVFDEAFKMNVENDEEKVYIYLMKYCEIMQLMKKKFQSEADKEYIILMNGSNLKKALKTLGYVKDSLVKR